MPQKYTLAYPVDFRHKVVEFARAGRGAAEFKIAGKPYTAGQNELISTRAVVARHRKRM